MSDPIALGKRGSGFGARQWSRYDSDAKLPNLPNLPNLTNLTNFPNFPNLTYSNPQPVSPLVGVPLMDARSAFLHHRSDGRGPLLPHRFASSFSRDPQVALYRDCSRRADGETEQRGLSSGVTSG
eukprot:Selendium_serpulae@DN9317_c0_g1_i1.p1